MDKTACMKSARNYSTKTEWETNEPGAIAAARKYRWLNECCAHMKN